jgi:hypothetical protein
LLKFLNVFLFEFHPGAKVNKKNKLSTLKIKRQLFGKLKMDRGEKYFRFVDIFVSFSKVEWIRVGAQMGNRSSRSQG